MGAFQLNISTNNAAFEDPGGELELARILRDAASSLEAGDWSPGEPKRIRDINGNTVGTWQRL